MSLLGAIPRSKFAELSLTQRKAGHPTFLFPPPPPIVSFFLGSLSNMFLQPWSNTTYMTAMCPVVYSGPAFVLRICTCINLSKRLLLLQLRMHVRFSLRMICLSLSGDPACCDTSIAALKRAQGSSPSMPPIMRPALQTAACCLMPSLPLTLGVCACVWKHVCVYVCVWKRAGFPPGALWKTTNTSKDPSAILSTISARRHEV